MVNIFPISVWPNLEIIFEAACGVLMRNCAHSGRVVQQQRLFDMNKNVSKSEEMTGTYSVFVTVLTVRYATLCHYSRLSHF